TIRRRSRCTWARPPADASSATVRALAAWRPRDRWGRTLRPRRDGTRTLRRSPVASAPRLVYSRTGMKGIPWLLAALALAGGSTGAVPCGGTTKNAAAGDDGGAAATTDDGGGAACTACQSDGDCGGGVCVTLAGGSWCAAPCDTNAQCASDTTCTPVE